MLLMLDYSYMLSKILNSNEYSLLDIHHLYVNEFYQWYLDNLESKMDYFSLNADFIL